jgi:hypothetical protein
MSSIPQEPLLAVSCHVPGKTMGRCAARRLAEVFTHAHSASYLISPLLLRRVRDEHFARTRGQKTPSTGMTAIAFAQQMCGRVHLYGFGNGSCVDTCYHYYECSAEASARTGSPVVTQRNFLQELGAKGKGATGGYHNFSAQAAVLRSMVAMGTVDAHWGRCDALAPAGPRNRGSAQAARRNRGSAPAARHNRGTARSIHSRRKRYE